MFTSKLYYEIKDHAAQQAVGNINKKLLFEPSGEIVWEDHEYMVLHILNNLDQFFSDMIPYLKTFSIPALLFDDLLSYQKHIMRRPGDHEAVVSLHYDIHNFLKDVYINQGHALREKQHRLKMTDSDVQPTWRDFGKFVVWYGRMGWSSYKDQIEAL